MAIIASKRRGVVNGKKKTAIHPVIRGSKDAYLWPYCNQGVGVIKGK
jgi:hypothetical protein